MSSLCRNHRPSIILVLFIFAAAISSSVTGAQRSGSPKKPDPQAQLMKYYRQYPDRYIRILEESWKLDDVTGTASHSFTLKNSAAVVYQEIEIRFTYLNSAGKTVHTRSVKIPGNLAPYQVRKIKDFKVKNVPAESDQVLLAVGKALVAS